MSKSNFKSKFSVYDVSAAALFFQIFTLLLLAILIFHPYSTDQFSHADPLIQLFRAHSSLFLIPVLCFSIGWFWVNQFPATSDILRKSLIQAFAAILAVTLACFTIRFLCGSKLPTFIPREESAVPGLTLGVSAGVLEEAVFRLMLLPALYFTFRKRIQDGRAKILAIVLTAFLFALSHEIGPGAHGFSSAYFLARFMIPGVVMGVLFFKPGPTFVVVLHCTAHFLIPFLFR